MQRILIINWTEMKHGREIFRGIWDYGHAHTNWRFEMFELEKWQKRLAALRGPFDGVIAAMVHKELIEPISACTSHLVNVSSHAWAEERFVTVRPDNLAIGRMAAEHLLPKGFTRFAFAGNPGHGPSLPRGIGFFESLLERDVDDLWAAGELHMALPERLRALVKPAQMDGPPEQTELTRLAERPTGMFATNCYWGRDLIALAHAMELRLPDQIAVVASDEDDFICETCDPALSAVDGNSRRVGYEAAALLHHLMDGGSAPEAPVEIPPLRVVSRRSSDAVAVEDELVAAALRYIRGHIDRPFSVEDVLDHVRSSRRALERRFKASLGRTPHREIILTRLERVKQLLCRTEWTVEEISRSCGFRYPAHMTKVFREATGTTPSAYRRQGNPNRPVTR